MRTLRRQRGWHQRDHAYLVVKLAAAAGRPARVEISQRNKPQAVRLVIILGITRQKSFVQPYGFSGFCGVSHQAGAFAARRMLRKIDENTNLRTLFAISSSSNETVWIVLFL